MMARSISYGFDGIRPANTRGEFARAPRPRLRVVLCDDHPLVRDGLRLVLGGEPDIEVIGEASGPEDLFSRVEETQPDVVVLDLTLDEHDGIPVLRDLRARHRRVAVVVLTMHRDPETVRQALLAGAAGYVVKGARSSDLLDAVRAVARGDRYIHSSVASTVIGDSVRWLRSGSGLSEREREVLGLVAAGQTARMVAKRLGISVHTVHRHVANLSNKLGVHGLPALVRFAVENGLVRGADAPFADASAPEDADVARQRPGQASRQDGSAGNPPA
jgi:two-component system response regulator NreC